MSYHILPCMKKEKIILSSGAVLLGLVVAAGFFYFFQIAKTPTPKTKIISIVSPTPTPTPIPSISLILDQPKDEEVTESKTITVSGKTRSDAVIAILINGVETITTPSLSGNFSTQITLSNGQNIIDAIAIAADGETKAIKKIVTYSEEEF